jgi:hypothetical protein
VEKNSLAFHALQSSMVYKTGRSQLSRIFLEKPRNNIPAMQTFPAAKKTEFEL